MSNLIRLINRRNHTMANLEDLAPFKDSRFEHERELWRAARKAYQVAEAEYRTAVAKTEAVHEH